MRQRRCLAAIGVLSLVAVSCGGDSESEGLDAAFNEPSSETNDETTSIDDRADAGTSALSGSDATLVQEWTVTDMITDEGFFISAVLGAEPTIEFFVDGTLRVNTGCRMFDGTFIISGAYEEIGETFAAADDGQYLKAGNFPSDDGPCEDDTATQDAALRYALNESLRWVFSDPSFILRDREGANLIVAELR